MDFGRGLSISEEESRNFQIQGTWKPATPATPAKPIQAPISLETQGSQISRTNWFESMGIPAGFVQETHSVNGGAACLDSMASLGQSRRVGNWESAMDLTSRTGSGSVVKSHTEAMMNVTAARKNQPLLNLLAWTTGASSSSSANLQGNNDLLFPGMYSASNYNQTQPDSAGMLLANVDPSLSLDFFNQSNYQSQPQNGFPVHHQSYDLNALPTTMTDCISNGAISVPFAPVTPEKGQITQNQPAERVNESIGERLYKEQDMQEVFVTPNRNVEIELNSGVCSNPFSCMNEVVQLQGELSHPLEGTTSMAASTTLNENHNLAMAADENGIDLNKTPNQKPKRKKHRPKVVVEGKPKKTPKTAAPKPTNDNPNPTGKRKYVRKKGLNNSGTPAAEALGETVEQSPSLTVKSCRRVLNFDMEAQRRDEHPSKSSNNQEFQLNSFESSSRQILSMNPGSHAQDLNRANHGGYGTKSSVELYEGVEVIAENTSPGIDYKCSSDPVIRDYNSLPETQAPAPQSTWSVPPIESSNCHPNNRGEMEKPCTNLSNGNNSHPLIQQHAQAEGISHMAFQTKATVGNNDKSRRPWLQCGSQSLSKCQLDSNSSLHVPFVENVQTEASKRDYSYTVNMTDAQTMNLREVQHNSLQAYQDRYQVSGYQRNHHSPSPQEISKKRRVEKFQYTTIPSNSSSTAAKQIDWGQALQSNHEAGDIEFNNMLGTNGSRNGASKSVRNVYEHTMARENHAVQNVSMGPLLHSSAFFSELQTSGYMLDFGHGERMTKKESKGSTQIQEANTATAIPQCTQLQSSPQKTAPAPGDTQHDEIVRRPKASLADPVAGNYKKRARKATAPVNSVDSSMNQVQQQENQIALYDQHQYLATSKGQPGIPLSYMTPIDDIVQRLKNLDINGETNRIPGSEQNALVPYNGNTTMVPYAGSFDPTRKRRPRPKVDLDPETHRVWRVLMGKEADEGMEQTEKDKDKEKWWEEERRVFRGRADSFIARMHLVQGDRRFSRWKGSVVDSVVGVFLTQNVSDHLSSSAFMSLAARFPLKTKSNERACCKEGIETSLEEPEVSIVETVDTINWHEKLPSQPVCDQSSVTFHEVGHIEEREVANSNESFGSNMGYGSSTDHSRAKQSPVCRISLEMSHDLLPKRTDSLTTNIGVENFTGEDRRAFEDILSSQNSTESTTSRITERNGSCSDSNSEAEDQVTHSPSKRPSDCLDDCTFTELLQMEGSQMFQDIYSCGSGNSLFDLGTKGEQNQAKVTDSNNHNSSMVRMDPLKDLSAHIHPPNSYPPQTQVPIIKSSTCSVKMTQDSGILEVKFPEMLGEERKSPLPSLTSIIGETTHANFTRKQNTVMPETVGENTCQKVQSSAQAEQPADLYGSLNKNQTETLYGLQAKTYGERNPKSFSHRQIPMKEALQSENTMFDEARNLDHTLVERQKSAMDPVSSSTEFSDIVDVETRYLAGQEKPKENNVIQSNVKEQVYNSATGSMKNLNTKKMKMEAGKNKDWDSLRKQAYTTYGEREKSSNTMDSLDWEAVRCANVNEIADAIKERGMNNMLAERIKDFLNRLVREHGAIDLEWLRDVPPDQTKEYLLSIRGLGLKSVECVRLLTLHHLAFPVDTNVGRIAVRLGWVPLQPLPESLQLHLLEMYPMLESIQKYLWPRLCKLDQRTLYELHYQMITFGKVFCTKSKPNCNACPMRGECKHFASAFASARFALPAPEEKSIVSSTVPVAAEHSPTLGINSHTVGINQMPLPLPEAEAYPLTVIAPENRKENRSCEPIIEVPATPEPEYTEISPSDMEDFFDEDPDEIPTIKLNIEEFTMTLENFMQEHSGELQEGDMSKALVALTPEMASIPAPKLKNVSRLRTEHQVYELPDSHHLLKGLDKREPDDPSSYLFAIWTPGETAESIEPPRTNCDSHESGKQCNEKTCFSCNSMREAASRTVRGTLLIPCRTAMRGSFPLNGTYFQVNEVFADHDSSVNPIEVPTAWLWNLPRRTVYFGTSIPTIFKGLTTEGIQHCFWRGLVCVRGFDQKTRAPRPLMARLHFPASRLAKAKDKKK